MFDDVLLAQSGGASRRDHLTRGGPMTLRTGTVSERFENLEHPFAQRSLSKTGRGEWVA